MLSFANFSSKIILDLNKTFPKARLEGKYVVVEWEPNSVSIPVSSIYREYQEVKDYRKTLKLYVDIINDILNQYKCIFRHIRTVIPELSGHCSGVIRTLFREHPDSDSDVKRYLAGALV